MPRRAVDLEPWREWIQQQIASGATQESVCRMLKDGMNVCLSRTALRNKLQAWNTQEPQSSNDDRVDDEELEDFISKFLYSGWTQAEIRDKVRKTYGITLSRYQLQAKLQEWNISDPRRQDISSWEDWIRDSIYAGQTQEAVRIELDNLGVHVTERTLRTWLQEWNIRVPNRADNFNDIDLDTVEAFISYYFFEVRLIDRDILYELQTKAGIHIGLTRLRTLRKEMFLRKQIPKEQVDEYTQIVTELMMAENDLGDVLDEGRRNLYDFMRRKYGVVGRELLYKVQTHINPSVVDMRRRKNKRTWSGWPYAGPGYALSMDAHCKLEYYGFEIYAGIDCWSRFVQWSYVGITARTAVSVMKQYLDHVETTGSMPVIVQTDRGDYLSIIIVGVRRANRNRGRDVYGCGRPCYSEARGV